MFMILTYQRWPYNIFSPIYNSGSLMAKFNICIISVINRKKTFLKIDSKLIIKITLFVCEM